MILVIDNYDSFTYNLVQRFGELDHVSSVYRNDEISLREIEILAPQHIVISPGPGTPAEAGISNDVIRFFAGKIPILGVCLGSQCIGHVFNGQIGPALLPVHGKTSLVFHDNRTIYQNIKNPFTAGRYHSLVVKPDGFPACLEITARTEKDEIMGIRHRDFIVEGIQIHPESILTEVGSGILANFVRNTSAKWENQTNDTLL